MSTIKSSAENLTLNADGANNDVIIQSNASTLVTVDGATGNVGIGNTNPVDAKLTIDNVAAGDSGLKITHGIGNSWGLFINSDVTTHSAIYADADSLTTGEIAYFYSNSADTSSRKMIRINNENAAATGTTALHVKQDSTGLAADFTGTGGIRSAGGIKFGTDTAAANALDDYEEGTFTPVISDGTNNATMASGTNKYTKVGRLVTLNGYMQTSSLGSVSGNVRITGLPFTSSTHSGGAIGYAVALNITVGYTVTLFIDPSTAYMVPYVWDATTGSTVMQSSEWSSDGFISYSFSYTV